MKRTMMARILAVLLVVSMICPTAVSAAGFGFGSGNTQSIGDWIRSTVEQIVSGWNRPGQGSGSNGGSTGNTGSTGGSQSWELVEDGTTVLNGDMLRASTYAQSVTDTRASSGTTLKYFPVTLYDYDTDTINNATHEADVNADPNLTEWNGIYFSDGGGSSLGNDAFKTHTYTTETKAHTDLTWAQVQSGTYYSDADCTNKVSVSEVTKDGYVKQGTVTCGTVINGYSWGEWEATNYYYYVNGEYYPLYAQRDYDFGTGVFIYTWGYSTDNGSTVNQIATQSGYASATVNIPLYKMGDEVIGYTLTANGETLATLNSTDTTQKVGVTLYTKGATTTKTLEYAAWNWWNKNSSDNSNGQKTYTGLVQSELDKNKNIVFNKPEGGIFNSDASVKRIYTGVEMPFVFDSAKQTYTFDATQYGVYFHEDATQGSSGTAGSNTRLYFNENSTQTNNTNYGDGSTTVWAPFNDVTSFSEDQMNYHFGMRATIPFTMTSNGRMNENNNESEAINFSFSGDDDVWVFIDGHLVIDLGGIHNRLNADIDFATGKVTYSEDNTSSAATGSFNDSSFGLTQDLFENLIPQDRETFAASETHELTIFYLERGKGSSNCKIEFNLPMKDTVTVTKRASQSWDKNTSSNSNLTNKEQEAVNNINFGFTLYKSTDKGETFTPVSNTKFKVLDIGGQVIDTRTTDNNGHFYLRNNNSARFVTTFSAEGTTYYVVEDDMASSGFVTPDFTYGGIAADGFLVDGKTYASGSQIPETVLELDDKPNKSSVVTVCGSDESEDSLVFVCENFLDATMPNPSAFPTDDQIVLDYGLSVNINLLGNDVYRGDNIEVVGIFGDGVELTDAAKKTVYTDMALEDIVSEQNAPLFGTAQLNGNTVSYQLTRQLTNVEVLTYLVKVTGTAEHTDGSEITAYSYGLAHVYIIPATTMYYEENFSDMVTYTDGKSSGWSAIGTAHTAPQEPGVVGTITDSPYGSDVAYLGDNGDSNGTSMYVNTSTGAAQFSYTFTGTGTSFFARTSNNTGYMRVQVSNGTTILRDTYYDDRESAVKGTLYNIPVFTVDSLPYGEYTVTVTIAKASTNAALTCHPEFYLDGIRVFNPLNTKDPLNEMAVSAYAADGETGMVNVTLRQKLLSNVIYVPEEREVPSPRLDENGNQVFKENGDPVFDIVTEIVDVPYWPDDGTFVLFTDTNGEIFDAEEYVSNGPKEEVYLYSGQSVTFTLKNWDPNTNRLFLGMKSPTGKAGQVTIGSQVISVNSTVDCYYEISNYGKIETDGDTKTVTFTITAGEGVLISLTNLKVTGNPQFTIKDQPVYENPDNEGGDVDGDDFIEEASDIESDEPDAAPGEDVVVEENENETPTEPVEETETEPESTEPEETEPVAAPEPTEEIVEGDE